MRETQNQFNLRPCNPFPSGGGRVGGPWAKRVSLGAFVDGARAWLAAPSPGPSRREGSQTTAASA